MSENHSPVRPGTILTHELEGDQTPSEGIVAAVSSASNTDPAALKPLATTIDPDAIDALFSDHYDGTPRGVGLVKFGYAGYEVVVNGNGCVSVLEDE
ncbi:HalOD1 output domain-containing protein [Halorussus pelagicus]|uniref:HalOD1 output domain-containing protein n=1 Tax=Halorussus pelagicus TaxID=2505977 RepID=UPI001408F238|nr:HalOD1 output domain-containing protein [Halorussus pelagicus]